MDAERYQTVFASNRGAIAAPTAGLHFTPELFERLRQRGVEKVEITLHVGYGTFQPVRAERVEDHQLEGESFSISAPAAEAINRAILQGRRVIAVGTTTTRALEGQRQTLATAARLNATTGTTDLFIFPGFSFRVIGGLLTNFHLPCSSLLMLVAAFGGYDLVMRAYRHAVQKEYRFYSYGDAMLLI
jgi:S-adenosylmethionine:tRNA ribosyltransferase-isomerase